MKIAEAIAKQEKALEAMGRTYVNMKKKGQKKGTIDSYLKGLETRWAEIRALDKQLEEVRDEQVPYFQGWIEEAEEIFLDQRGQLLEALYELEKKEGPPTAVTATNNAPLISERSARRNMPKLDLPKFSGKYSEWASFKDLFLAMVAPPDLTKAERLQYLKACVAGEAATLIKNFSVTSDNYDRAWAKLTETYDNQRLVINACLNSLFQLEPLTKESIEGLKQLGGTTDDTIEVLSSLGRPVDQWGDVLVFIVLQRLDPISRHDWEMEVGDSREPSTYADVKKFLGKRIRALEAVEKKQETLFQPTTNGSSRNQGPKRGTGKIVAHNSVTQRTPATCKYCSQTHFIANCEEFQALAVNQRKEFVTKSRLCFNCLGTHGVRDCRSQKTCHRCRGKHHTMLHLDSRPTNTQGATVADATARTEVQGANSSAAPSSEAPATLTAMTTMSKINLVLLATARVVLSANGRKVTIRALVDPCSQSSFIKESLVQLLRISRTPVSIAVGGIGGGSTNTSKSQVSVNISPWFPSERSWKVNALVLQRLTDYLPPLQCIPANLPILADQQLADPYYQSSEPVDMILGVDLFTHIILPGLQRNDTTQWILQQTTLGWILSGSLAQSMEKETTNHSTITNEDLLNTLNKFWAQEEIPTVLDHILTEEEKRCDDHYTRTVSRDAAGKYILRLPFKDNVAYLADSFSVAKRMLLRMERRFSEDPDFKRLYCEFIKEYIQLGHAEVVNEKEVDPKRAFYLPHHGIVKRKGAEAKIRVVFNGSVKLPGLNLNECLLAGRKLQTEVIDIIQNWRLLRFVWTTDIVKMFRQMWISKEDRDYQLIMWRENSQEDIKIIRLCTVTYGLVCAPYQALRTLLELDKDEGSRYKEARLILSKRMYMDDAYGGADSLEEAKRVRYDFVQLLKAGGFPLGKWRANHCDILAGLPTEQPSSVPLLSFEAEEPHSVLGLNWLPNLDVFSFKMNWPIEDNGGITKRHVLSQSARLYDPLGWIAPITICFKIFMQTLWKMGAQWDDLIPESRHREWMELIKDLKDISRISIPRRTSLAETQTALELHGFADASEKAMGAVIYLRNLREGPTYCNILIAKTKVAPLKKISLPRLELNAAAMLANLMKHQVEVLEFKGVPKFLWSDSTVALSWIYGHPSKWSTFVANRVSTIQTAVPDAIWLHVAGKINPADLASRGTKVHDLLTAEQWFSGPDFFAHEPR